MNGAAWFITVFMSVLFAVFFALSFVPFFVRYTTLRHAQLIELRLPDHLEPVVGHRLMTRLRGGMIGGLVFTAIAAAAFQWQAGAVVDSDLTGLFVIGTAFVGLGAGTAVAALTGSVTIAPDQPRVARSGAVAVKDYLAPLELVGARVVVVGAVLLLAYALVVRDDIGAAIFGVAFFAVTAVIALALFEVVSRRIVDQSQPAGSTAELVWDDAIRSSTLRDLVTAPLALGAYCLIFGAFGVAEAANPAAGYIGGFCGIAVAVAAILSRVTRTQSFFLRRLWPNLRWSDTDEKPSAV
jgi:hypothetical protein